MVYQTHSLNKKSIDIDDLKFKHTYAILIKNSRDEYELHYVTYKGYLVYRHLYADVISYKFYPEIPHTLNRLNYNRTWWLWKTV